MTSLVWSMWLAHRYGDGTAFRLTMVGQPGTAGDRGFQPGAPGAVGLWTGPGLPSVRMGLGLGVQLGATDLGVCPGARWLGCWLLPVPLTWVGVADWAGWATGVAAVWFTLGRGMVIADGRRDLSWDGLGAPKVSCAKCWIGSGSTPAYAALILPSPAAVATSAAASGSLARAGRPDSQRRAGREAAGEMPTGEASRANAASAVASPASSSGSPGPATAVSRRARSCISGGAPGGEGADQRSCPAAARRAHRRAGRGRTQASHHA